MKLQVDRHTAPAVRPLEFNGFPAPVAEKINQHFPCYLYQSTHADVVRLDMVVPAGSWSQQKALQASTFSRMLNEGTKSHDAFALAEAIDRGGAYLEIGSSYHFTTISLYAVRHILVSLLPIVKSVLTEPVFPLREMEVLLANNKQDFIISNKKVMGIARRMFPSLLYGEKHPYGRMLSEAHFDQVHRDDLLEYYSRWPLSESRLYLSGHIDDNVLGALSELLSDDQFIGHKGQPEAEFVPEPKGEKETYIEVPGAVQSAIIMGLPVIGRHHPDFPKLMFASTILGGYFGSRLMKSIREEKGYTYGISGGINARLKAAQLTIQTEVKAETTRDATDEIFRQILRLSDELVDMEEFDTARNYLAGQFLRSLDGPFQLSDRLQTMHAEGIDPTVYYPAYWKQLFAATPEDIRDMVRRYIQPEKMKTLIVGKM